MYVCSNKVRAGVQWEKNRRQGRSSMGEAQYNKRVFIVSQTIVDTRLHLQKKPKDRFKWDQTY
jgi:hypothetical protein